MAICDLGCPVEARSATGDTALHVMTKKFRYDCALGLMIRGADAGALDSAGNSSVHMAIEVNNDCTLLGYIGCYYFLMSSLNGRLGVVVVI